MGTKRIKQEYTRPSREARITNGPGAKEFVLLLLEPSTSKLLHNPRSFPFTFEFRERDSDFELMLPCFISGLPWGLSYAEGEPRHILLTSSGVTPLEQAAAELVLFKGKYDFISRKGSGRIFFRKIGVD